MPGWLLVVLGSAVIVAGATLPALRLRDRKRGREGAQARARMYTERLGFCLETLHAGDDRIADRLLTDATERWNTAGGLLSRSQEVGELQVAEEVAREGLRYVRRACRRLQVPVPQLPGTQA
jgi:hypothetical protein